MPKPWRRRSGRRKAIRKVRRYLIVCEDEKSSVFYLKGFAIPGEYAEVVTVGGMGNTSRVVEEGLRMKDQAERDGQPFIHVWCVIDRDSFPTENFRRAFDLVRGRNDIAVIWANECFELWYLLHFCYRDTPIGRHDLCEILAGDVYIGRRYEKADSTIYTVLDPRIHDALRNAHKLEASYRGNIRPESDNPSTNFHWLVEKLMEIKDGVINSHGRS